MEIVSENSAKIVIFQIFYFSAVLAWLIATRPGSVLGCSGRAGGVSERKEGGQLGRREPEGGC
eukprot:2150417-Rhodomonas_salina.2